MVELKNSLGISYLPTIVLAEKCSCLQYNVSEANIADLKRERNEVKGNNNYW